MKLIDMHCDTLGGLLSRKEAGNPASLRRNEFHVDLERMKESHYLVQNFAMFVPLRPAEDPWERMLAMYRIYQEEMERNRDMIAPVLAFSDIAGNEAAGKLSALLTVEEGAVCKGQVEKLRELLGFVLPLYREEGKTVLVVAVGCTGGRHRSVAVTHALAGFIASLGYQVTENHRDMTRN